MHTTPPRATPDSVTLEPTADADALLALPEAEHLRYLLASLRGAALAVLRRPCGDRRRGDALIELEKWCELTAHVDDPR